jgi:signal transduction histidine kinase
MAYMQRVAELEEALTAADAGFAADGVQRIDLLNTRAWELSDSDASRAMALARLAYALADAPVHDAAQPYRRGIAYSLRTQGYLDMRSGDYPRGMERLFRAQTLLEALRAEDDAPVDDALIDVFDGIAGIYGQMGDFAECLAYSYKMLDVAERNGDARRVANARNNLGHIAMETGDYAQARTILQANAELAARIAYPRIEAISHLNLANTAFITGDAPTALNHALRGLEVVQAAGLSQFEAYALDYLGKIALRLGEQAVGLDYLQQALAASQRIGSKVTEAINLITLGNALAEVGRSHQALVALQRSVAVAEAIQAKPEQIAAHQALAALYEREGDAAAALAHFKQYHALKELVAGEKVAQRLKVLQVVHDTETARSQAAALRRQAADLQRAIDERTSRLRETVDQLRTEVQERQRAEAATQAMAATLERRLAARTAEVATFFDLILLAGQAIKLTDVFSQVLPRIIEVTRSDAISIHVLDASRTELQLAGQINFSTDFAPVERLKKLPKPFKRWLMRPADPLLATNIAALSALPPAFHALGLQTYLGAQIKIGARVEGVLSCYRASNRGYGVDEVALATALAEQIGMMLAAQQLRQNTRALAIVEERQRLARDMHDSVSQTLYSLALFAQTGREAVEDGDNERLVYSLDNLQQTTLQALREMRLLLYELRPADLQQAGLIRALELRLDAVERRTDLQLSVQMTELGDLDPRVEAELYYIVVEALNNVLKHAAATHVTLLLGQADGQVRIQIADDGRGFTPHQQHSGMGLRNIAERVARLNGRLTIVSAPGNGARLEALIPFDKEIVL